MKDLSGLTIASYQLVEEIGKGAMAVVYKAFQPSLDRWVAVKVLDPAYTGRDIESLARFRREAKAIAALRHPNILMVYDCGEQDDLEFIAMEFVAGGTLKRRLTGTSFNWKRAASLAIGIGQALAYAHSHSIVHRDVKPGNVLLPRDNWPLLADFGLAKIKQSGHGLTDPGVSLGTPAYTSPEQALGDPVDHRADIYALGVVLFEMATGRVPYQASRPFEVLLMHISEPAPRPRALVPDLPEDLERIILKALEKDPDSRYDDMLDMVGELESLGGLGVATRPAQPDAQSWPPDYATTEIAGARAVLVGPHFTVAATGTPLPIPHQDEVLIGRSDPATNTAVDIDVTNLGGVESGVSRQHARLMFASGSWTIEDMGSTNGTYLNKEQIPPFEPRKLRDGDVIDLGQMALTFRSGQSD
jgi:serine/threonine protein kinase